MNKKKQIDQLIEEALHSADNIERASPKPFLLTRIHARLNNSNESSWEKIARYIGRPSIAFSGLAMLILINVLVLFLNPENASSIATEQSTEATTDEFYYTAATIYDFENTEP